MRIHTESGDVSLFVASKKVEKYLDGGRETFLGISIRS
jgi:hypothetical protein